MTGIELLNERNCTYIASSSREPGQPAFTSPEPPLPQQTLSAFTVNMPATKATSDEASTVPDCQFNEAPCPTESPYRRKVVSHIFGRNKKCTRALPDWVWTYYCRKHYQRAKYRMNGWGVHQSELAIRAVENMHEWGGVESFNLQLRRREADRTSKQENDTAADTETSPNTANSAAREASLSMSPGQHSITSANDLSSPSPAPQAVSPFDGSKKKGPTIVPCPVPKWLSDLAGKNKTYDEILSILETLRCELTPLSDEPDTVPDFPDIEILPNIKPEYVEVAEKNPRVNKKGAIKKI